MFTTKSAQALRHLFAGYHEPTGLSRQQSQKLLDGLKASFRSQLDREYGGIPGTAPASGAVARAADTDVHHVRHSAASRHLKSILSNPLFSYDQRWMDDKLAGASKRDPMDVFDHAVAKGMMALRAATGCLVAKRQSLVASATDMGSTKTASRVTRWLRASGAETSLEFLDDQGFIRALAPLLVAEGLESVAWEWAARTVNETSSAASAAWHSQTRIRRAAFLLAQLVHVKSQPHYGDLDAAIRVILDAEQRFYDSPLLPRLLVLPWRSVSWLTTVESHNRPSPSEDLFDAHMAAAKVFRPHAMAVERAHLHLHHPTHPDGAPAMRFFKNKQKLHDMVSKTKLTAPGAGLGILPWIAFLGHDTVSHLTKSGRTREAQSVTQLLRDELADISVDLSPT